jgi:hypothetical protein
MPQACGGLSAGEGGSASTCCATVMIRAAAMETLFRNSASSARPRTNAPTIRPTRNGSSFGVSGRLAITATTPISAIIVVFSVIPILRRLSFKASLNFSAAASRSAAVPFDAAEPLLLLIATSCLLTVAPKPKRVDVSHLRNRVKSSSGARNSFSVRIGLKKYLEWMRRLARPF